MNHAGRRLLVVDDDPQVGKFLSHVARGCGYDVRVTENADDFRATYLSWSPDMLILDLAMPDVDGIELLRFLAAQKCQAGILIASGHDVKVLESAHRLGTAHGLSMVGSLSKPLRVADLREALDRSPE